MSNGGREAWRYFFSSVQSAFLPFYAPVPEPFGGGCSFVCACWEEVRQMCDFVMPGFLRIIQSRIAETQLQRLVQKVKL